jgi:hypothetical protein
LAACSARSSSSSRRGVAQALGPRPRDRPTLGGTLLVEPALSLAQPDLPTLGLGQIGRQLIAACRPEAVVLGRVGGDLLGHDRLGQLLVVHGAVAVGVGRDLGAVDGQDVDGDQAGVGAEDQDLAEQLAQRALVADDEPGDRRVVGSLPGGDHAAGHVLQADALNAACRSRSARPAVQQQRDHHRRLIGRSAVAVLAIGGVERRGIHHADGVDDEPGQVVLGQPLPNVRRQQERLLAIARQEVLRHSDILNNTSDRRARSPSPQTGHSRGSGSATGRTYQIRPGSSGRVDGSFPWPYLRS